MTQFPFSFRAFSRPTLLLIASAALGLRAQTGIESVTTLERIEVSGRAADLIGAADSASQGSVGYHELEARPFLRRGELLEVIPGVVITQHSGGGKANQYFLRGFNLDHGTDFSVSVDGMPVNLRTHAHGQGYADLNFIIPELVREVNYNKGPFYAEVGDFSAAGAAEFRLFDDLPRGFLSVTGGSGDYSRLVMADSLRRRNAVTTYGVEATYNDGPWALAEHFRRVNGMVRHHWENGDQQFGVTALVYAAKWRSTDQIPLRSVAAGALDRFGVIDPSDQGESERASLSFDWSAKAGETETHFNAYALYYHLDLYSNFTYFLDDSVNGDQFNQRDRRIVLGGAWDERFSRDWNGRTLVTTVGLQARDDVIDQVALNRTNQRQHVEAVRDDEVNEASMGIFGRTEITWSNWFRSTAGLRSDYYRFDVKSDNPMNSGARDAAIVSPKLSLVLGPWKKTELYFNAGYGFHSNDARGTTIRVDPVSGDPADRVSPLVRSRGVETGLRTSAFRGLVSSVSVWFLDLDSELVFTGDSGGTEASGATRRYGIEFANFYRATSWLTFDADLSLTRARFREEVEGGGRQIPNSIGAVVTAGTTVNLPSGYFGSVRLRYFGPQPLIENDAARGASTFELNGRVGYRYRDWDFALEVLNLLDRKNNDIAYFYTSRLPGEPAEGVDDVHFHPAEPRALRFTVTRRF